MANHVTSPTNPAVFQGRNKREQRTEVALIFRCTSLFDFAAIHNSKIGLCISQWNRSRDAVNQPDKPAGMVTMLSATWRHTETSLASRERSFEKNWRFQQVVCEWISRWARVILMKRTLHARESTLSDETIVTRNRHFILYLIVWCLEIFVTSSKNLNGTDFTPRLHFYCRNYVCQ